MYNPLKDYRAKDSLPSGDPAKIIRGSDIQAELEAISDQFKQTGGLASCKFNGDEVKYGYNVRSVESVGSGAYRINFSNPINSDGGLTAGDFAGVLTPYTTNGLPVIGFITDQRESYVDVGFRQLSGGSWEAPSRQGFAFLLIDQVPETS